MFRPTRPAGSQAAQVRGKQLTLQPGLDLVFKSADDAAACRIAVPSTDHGTLLVLDPSHCQREARLICDAAPVRDSLKTVPSDAVLSLTVTAELQAQDGGEGIQWISLLNGPTGGPHAEWKKVAKRVRTAPGEHTRLQWRLEVPGGWQGDDNLYLAVQMAPRSGPVAFRLLAVEMDAIHFTGGGLTVENDLVSGWLPTTDEHTARLLIGQGGMVVAGVSLTQVAAGHLSIKGSTVSFAFVADRLARWVAGADVAPSPVYDLVLVAAGKAVAQTRISLMPSADAASEAESVDGVSPSRLIGPEPIGPLSLARADVATLQRELVVALDPGLVRDTLQVLYKGGERETLWALWDELGQGSGRPDLDAYLAYYFAQAMLQHNMASLAYQALEGLIRRPESLACLTQAEQRQARLLLARAAVRCGRPQRAIHELDGLKHEDPADWEVHFDLGLIHDPANLNLSRRHFRLAEVLEPDMPVMARAVLLENMLDEGRPEYALLDGTLAVKQHGIQPDLLFGLANTYRALGDRYAWAAYLNRVFALSNLASGMFDADLTSAASLLEGLSVAAPRAYAGSATPLVTVIMTAYNAEATIRAAVQSVLHQSYPDVRLVVVDDASTDRTRDIVATLAEADDRVVLLHNPVNKGTYWSKNRALHEFQSDYYTFHDADDWMHPERVAIHVERMLQGEGAVASVSRWFRMTEEGRVMLHRRFGAASASYVTTNPASLFIAQEVVDRIGYFDNVRAAADSEYTYRITRAFGRAGLVDIPLPLGIGLHHGASLTQSGPAAFDRHRYSRVRQQYWEAWMAWHRSVAPADLCMPFPDGPRPFEAPVELLP